MRTNYDKRLIEYATKHSTEYNVKEWQQIMEDKFDTHFNQKQMRHFFYMRGLKMKSMNNRRRSFNQNMYNFLTEHAQEHTIREWLDILNKKYNEDFTLSELQHYFVRHHFNYLYEEPLKSNDGNAYPIGSERVKGDGMVQVKVAPHKWEYKQRYIYEKYHNVELKDNEYVIFLDGNRNNFDIDNLQVATATESGCMASLGVYTKDKNLTKLGLDVARLKIKTIQKKRGEI